MQTPLADTWAPGHLCSLHKDALHRFQNSLIKDVQIPRREMVTRVFTIKHIDSEGIHVSTAPSVQGDKRPILNMQNQRPTGEE